MRDKLYETVSMFSSAIISAPRPIPPAESLFVFVYDFFFQVIMFCKKNNKKIQSGKQIPRNIHLHNSAMIPALARKTHTQHQPLCL